MKAYLWEAYEDAHDWLLTAAHQVSASLLDRLSIVDEPICRWLALQGYRVEPLAIDLAVFALIAAVCVRHGRLATGGVVLAVIGLAVWDAMASA